MLRLILHRGRREERAIEIQGTLTIGRGSHNTLEIADDNLSRSHLRIDVVDGRAVLADLGSRNGTFVNDVRVDRRELEIGDVIRCGGQVFDLAGGEDAERRSVLLHTRAGAVPGPVPLRVPSASMAAASQHRLEILLEVSRLLSSPEPIDAILQKILDLLFKIFEIDGAAVLLVGESGALEPRAVQSRDDAKRSLVWSHHIVEHVRRSGEAALFCDVAEDPRIVDKGSILMKSIRASMCAPLRPKQDVIGVIYVDNRRRPDRFTEGDLEFLGAFANQAAIAIENAQLYKRIEDEAVLRNNLLRFFPPATIQKLAGTKGAALEVMDVEVTALFADISGFTEMSSRMEPREVVELLNQYFPRMAKIVFDHEGTLEKYIGDALLAVWGAPFPQPDDADRAVLAAIRMQHAAEDLAEELAESGRPPIKIHIGLNSGRVAAGNIGSDHYLQYATVGDTTNIASRICSAAPAGEIWVAANTLQKLLDLSIRRQPLTPLRFKGKEEELGLYRILWE